VKYIPPNQSEFRAVRDVVAASHVVCTTIRRGPLRVNLR
jgi:hypothetical protein